MNAEPSKLIWEIRAESFERDVRFWHKTLPVLAFLCYVVACKLIIFPPPFLLQSVLAGILCLAGVGFAGYGYYDARRTARVLRKMANIQRAKLQSIQSP
jgi:uncharacterized membrane protein